MLAALENEYGQTRRNATRIHRQYEKLLGALLKSSLAAKTNTITNPAVTDILQTIKNILYIPFIPRTSSISIICQSSAFPAARSSSYPRKIIPYGSQSSPLSLSLLSQISSGSLGKQPRTSEVILRTSSP